MGNSDSNETSTRSNEISTRQYLWKLCSQSTVARTLLCVVALTTFSKIYRQQIKNAVGKYLPVKRQAPEDDIPGVPGGNFDLESGINKGDEKNTTEESANTEATNTNTNEIPNSIEIKTFLKKEEELGID